MTANKGHPTMQFDGSKTIISKKTRATPTKNEGATA